MSNNSNIKIIDSTTDTSNAKISDIYINIKISDTNINTNSFSRPARMEDFFDDADTTNNKNKDKYKYNNNNKERIDKNQQEFGHKKRIKP
jgi:hypothetical protein